MEGEGKKDGVKNKMLIMRYFLSLNKKIKKMMKVLFILKKSVILQPQKLRRFFEQCLGGGIGRHAGLKIP